MQANFLNRYLYSPVTWLHSLSPHIKISITLVFLHLVNYINSQLIIVCIFVYFLVLVSLKLSYKYIRHLLKVLGIITIPTILNSLINKKAIYLSKSRNFCIYIISSIKLIHQKNFISIVYYKYLVPEFIFRVCLLNILNCLSLQTLFITTPYEDIIVRTVNLYKLINPKSSKAVKTFVIIVNCSSQFAIEIVNYLYKTRTIFKLHNYPLYSYYMMLIYSILNVMNFIKNYIYNAAITLNTRARIKTDKSIF